MAGKTILEHSLAVLHDHPMVDRIIVMMAPGHLDAVRAIVKDGNYVKVTDILEGGETRNDTTLRALSALSGGSGDSGGWGTQAGEGDPHVLFHDAVRPLLAPRTSSPSVRGPDAVCRRRRGDRFC